MIEISHSLYSWYDIMSSKFTLLFDVAMEVFYAFNTFIFTNCILNLPIH